MRSPIPILALSFCLPLLLLADESESASKWITTDQQWSELESGKVILLNSTLSSEEDAEYKDFVEAADVISILQAKARAILEKTAA